MPYRRGNVDPIAKTGRVGTLADVGSSKFSGEGELIFHLRSQQF